MAGLFSHPTYTPTPAVNPADTQNRLNDALVKRLQGGGTNADTAQGGGGNLMAPSGAGRQPTLTGLN